MTAREMFRESKLSHPQDIDKSPILDEIKEYENKIADIEFSIDKLKQQIKENEKQFKRGTK